jgi:hypothetical protein
VDSGWLEVDTTHDLATYEEMERAGTLAALYRSSAVPAWSRKA